MSQNLEATTVELDWFYMPSDFLKSRSPGIEAITGLEEACSIARNMLIRYLEYIDGQF